MTRIIDLIARGPGGADRVAPPKIGERCARCHARRGRGFSHPCMLCAPHLVPLGAYVADRMASRAWCYWVFPGWWRIEDRNRYTFSIVIENELGHFPTSMPELSAITPHMLTAAAEAPDLELAALEARWLNCDRGLADRETDRIVASSIGADRGRGERLL